MSDSDDDNLALRPDTLALLQGFIKEKDAQEERFARAERDGGSDLLSMDAVQEDWQLSQFWYTDETATALAREAIAKAGPAGTIACISCPTLYTRLRAMGCSNPAKVLEFDKRFAIHGSDFVFYDYNTPLGVADTLERQSMDVVVVDPPFLNEECLRKMMQTVEYLSRGAVVLCTGYVMQRIAHEHGLHPCLFHPAHTGLANEFRVYTNYERLAYVVDNESEALGVDRDDKSLANAPP